MISLILQTATRFLLPLLLLFSVFLLLRGHNLPGGGFIAGLVVSAALALYAMAYDFKAARRILRVEPRTLMGAGLLLAVASGLLAWLAGLPFMTGLWDYVEVRELGRVDLGTPLLFDAGVYLVVIGVVQTIILALEEAEEA